MHGLRRNGVSNDRRTWRRPALKSSEQKCGLSVTKVTFLFANPKGLAFCDTKVTICASSEGLACGLSHEFNVVYTLTIKITTNIVKKIPGHFGDNHSGGSREILGYLGTFWGQCASKNQQKSPIISYRAFLKPLIYKEILAEWTGLEPATPGVTGRYSNQLNYHSW